MKTVRRVTFDAMGWAIVGTGVVGIFLPIIPGVLLLIIGLYLLSIHSERFGGILRKQLVKYPKFAPMVGRLDRRVKRFFNVEG